MFYCTVDSDIKKIKRLIRLFIGVVGWSHVVLQWKLPCSTLVSHRVVLQCTTTVYELESMNYGVRWLIIRDYIYVGIYWGGGISQGLLLSSHLAPLPSLSSISLPIPSPPCSVPLQSWGLRVSPPGNCLNLHCTRLLNLVVRDRDVSPCP